MIAVKLLIYVKKFKKYISHDFSLTVLNKLGNCLSAHRLAEENYALEFASARHAFE